MKLFFMSAIAVVFIVDVLLLFSHESRTLNWF